jgi:hypothetical protein
MKLLAPFRLLLISTFLLSNLFFIQRFSANASDVLECDPYRKSEALLTREYLDEIVNLEAGKPIDALIVFVEFENRRAIYSDRRTLSKVSKKVSEFYSFMSEGEIWFNWIEHKDVIQVGKDTNTYRANFRGNAGIALIIEDVQKILARGIEIHEMEYMLIVTPSTTLDSELSSSIAYLDRGVGIVNSAILASDFWNAGGDWKVVAHEIGHGFGLLDLYSTATALLVSAGKASLSSQFEFMKSYDLMNSPSARSPSFVMWNRFQLVPTLSSRIICYQSDTVRYRLVSINSTKSGFKAILVPLSDSSLLMIEVRDDIGMDAKIHKSDLGVITYTVSLQAKSGEGPLLMDCSQASKSKYANCGLKVGHSRSIDGVRVTLTKQKNGEFFASVVRRP